MKSEFSTIIQILRRAYPNKCTHIHHDLQQHHNAQDLMQKISQYPPHERHIFLISQKFSDYLTSDGNNLYLHQKSVTQWHELLAQHFSNIHQIPLTNKDIHAFTNLPTPILSHLTIRIIFLFIKLARKFTQLLSHHTSRIAGLFRNHENLAELYTALRDKNVTIIGNARSLQNQSYGAEINTADIVIRLNRGPIITASSHGIKTDWIATSIDISKTAFRHRNVRRLLWMSPSRKKIQLWMLRSTGFFLYPKHLHAALKTKLNARPSTGIMIIDLIARSPARSLCIYGFDFFASNSLSGNQTIHTAPHNFSAEATVIKELAAQDPRIKLCLPPQ